MDTPADLAGLGRALRRALAIADMAALAGLLAEEVGWLGARGGACRGRDEVLAVVKSAFDFAAPFSMVKVRTVGVGLVLEVALDLVPDPSAEINRWLGVVLADEAGRILRVQQYESVEVAEQDLRALAGPSRQSTAPATPVVDLVPFVHVADVGRSAAFYRLLGLEVSRTHEEGGALVWAFLRHEGACLMLAAADEPVEGRDQAVLFYLYSHDLVGLRHHLLRAGVLPSEIVDGSPGPRREMRVTDPDGYCLMIAEIEDQGRAGDPG